MLTPDSVAAVVAVDFAAADDDYVDVELHNVDTDVDKMNQ